MPVIYIKAAHKKDHRLMSSSHSDMTITAMNAAIARRALSLPQLAEFAASRPDLESVYLDDDWRRGRGFSRKAADAAKAAHAAEAGVKDKPVPPANGRGEAPPPPQTGRNWNTPISNRIQIERMRPPSTAPQARDAAGNLRPVQDIVLP
jgi:hypothetical protein